MKRYISLFLTVLTVFGLFSCREQEMGCIVADKKEFVFEFTASDQFCTVTGAHDIRAVSDKGWCAASLSEAGKDNLRIRVLANPGETARHASVTLSASGCENVVLKVIQGGLEDSDLPYLMAEVPGVEADCKASEVSVTVYTNQDDVTVVSHPEWCAAEFLQDKEEDNLRLGFEANVKSQDRSGKVVLRASGCDDLVLEVLQEGVMSADCELLSFEVKADVNSLEKNIVFDFDKNARTLDAMYLKWIDKEEPEMLVPVFSMKGEKAMVGDKEVVSGKTAVSFADDFDFVVVAENGDTKSYRVSLNCPQINRELPVLHMKPQQEITSKDNYVDTDIELYDRTPGSTGEGWYKGLVEMRGRGNSTWGLQKKPYKMKFPDGFSPIGLNHASKRDWTLLAQDMDKSLIRTHIAFEYSRILLNPDENYHHEKAVLFTPASKFVNVYLTGYYTGGRRYWDGEYFGVYQMSDQMERAKGRIDVDKLKASDGDDPAKITGGYIIETDLHEGRYNSPRKRIKMTYKYPEDDDCHPAQYDYITDFIGKAENALYGSRFKDPVNGWRKYLDEKTLADFIIIKELVGDYDGYTSTYMYKRRGVDKLFFGPVWDCDKGWNNDKRTPHYEYPWNENLMIHAGFWMPPYVDHDWFQRLWEDETFRDFVRKRWNAKKDELLAVTERVLDEIPVDMRKAIDANFSVWEFYFQSSEEANMPAKTYAEEIERIRTLTRQRASLLDRLFK